MVFRRRRSSPPDPLAHVDPASVPPRFRSTVTGALDARRRFGELRGTMPDGPLRAQFDALATRVEAGVADIWETVQRAVRIEQAATGLDPERVAADLKQAKRADADGHGDPHVLSALTERFAATQRLLNAVDDLDDRLRLVDARLHAVVARGAELALVNAPDALSIGMDALDADLDGALEEIATLRHALDDVSTTP